MKLNIGILGAGKIAAKMANTVAAMQGADVQVLAVASRELPRAQAFAAAHHVPRAYGSYEAMLADADVQLVYVATPHSHHARHTALCLAAGKHVLCEKAFTVNEAQARRVTAMAREKGLLLAEAIWTRYMPSRELIASIIASGELGHVHSLQANLGYPIWEVSACAARNWPVARCWTLAYTPSTLPSWPLGMTRWTSRARPACWTPAWTR